MKWTILIAACMLTAALSTTSFGADLSNSEIIINTSEYLGGGDATCGCEKPSCCKCPKPKYWKAVCRTHVKRKRSGCGCCKQVTKVCVTKTSYRRVLCPRKHCPDDLVCSPCRPPCTTTCEPLCGCGSK